MKRWNRSIAVHLVIILDMRSAGGGLGTMTVDFVVGRRMRRVPVSGLLLLLLAGQQTMDCHRC